MEMDAQQQENDDEISDEYRSTTNGSDTTAPDENNEDIEDVNGTKNEPSTSGMSNTPNRFSGDFGFLWKNVVFKIINIEIIFDIFFVIF